jgi:hypothetical protein
VVHLHSSKAGVLGRIACLLLSKKSVLYSPWLCFSKNRYYTYQEKTYRAIEFYFKKYPEITIACGDTEFEIAKK